MKSDPDRVLFASAYLLCLFDAMLMGYSVFGALPNADAISLGLRGCAAALVLIKLILDRYYSLSMLLRAVFVGLILLIPYVRSGYSHLFYMLLFFLGSRNVPVERIVRFDFRSRLLLFAGILLCAALGLIENYVTYRTGSEVLRYSLGFTHPNTLASLVLSFVLEDAWINRRRCGSGYAAVIWLLALTVYVITANRTAVTIMVIFPAALWLIQTRDWKTDRRNLSWLFPALAVFSFAAMLLCSSNPFFRTLDQALSNRFYNAKRVYSAYGISLLGQHVTLVSVRTARLLKIPTALLDVAYLRILIQGGPLALMLLGFFYSNAMGQAYQMEDSLLCLIFVIYLFFGICESGFNNAYMNFTLFFAAQTVFAPGSADPLRKTEI